MLQQATGHQLMKKLFWMKSSIIGNPGFPMKLVQREIWSIFPIQSCLEIVFQEQSYLRLQLGQSLALAHIGRIITDLHKTTKIMQIF